MIKFSERLWVGNSVDWYKAKVDGFGAVLNVAMDLRGEIGWPFIEYAQVGLVDGPGNPLSAYCGAVLTLDALLRRHERVLLYCHEGRSRSAAVGLMYLSAVTGRGWSECLEIVEERNDVELPAPHPAHRAAHDRMDWVFLKKTVGQK